jgi:uncharacterized membrane protein YgcG
MKRFLLGFIAVLLAVTLGASSPSSAAVNDFTISSYNIDYYLGSDDHGRSTLKTVETIVADFPAIDQNHGLERAIPTSYDGHPTALNVQSVTDAAGNALHYSTSTVNGNEVLRIGDANSYVHGPMAYIITYTQRDVTRYFANTAKDEFYWDTNGTQWAVPITELAVRIHLDHSIMPTFMKDMACYQGREGSTDRCNLTQTGDVITTSVSNLQPYENVTVALGFGAGTFIGYQQTPMEKLLATIGTVWAAAVVPTSAIAVVCFIWLTRRYNRISERKQDIGSIVPEYLPPKNYSALVSAQIEGSSAKALTATLLDLAVRHYIKIYQIPAKSIFRAIDYELELVKPGDDLTKEERVLISLLFNDSTAMGRRFAMSSLKRNYKLGRALEAATKTTVTEDIKGDYGLRRKGDEAGPWFRRFGLIALIAGILSLSPLLLILSLAAYLYGKSIWPLTDAGVALRRYLLGLKMYISVAEADRLKMLQSPEGADKIGSSINVGDSTQLVKLYERVLPYAVLFGQETEWNKQLGAYYETTNNQPDWYSGTGAFNAVAFGTAMSSFTSTSTYATSSSSTSGGSGGGGFSGGGGGGGGGGGW